MKHRKMDRASASQEYIYGAGGVDTISYERANNGNKTLEDYYALPEYRRAELIDGVIYDMPSPSVTHQETLVNVLAQICNYIKNNKGKCKMKIGDKIFEITDYYRINDTDKKKDYLTIKLIIPDKLSDITFMFHNCSSIVEIDNIENWDLSKIADIKDICLIIVHY